MPSLPVPEQLRLFSEQVQAMRVDHGHYAIPVDDVVDEILDLAGFHHTTAGRLTLADLVRCGQGGLIIALLLSAAAFEEYDRREMLDTPNEAAPANADEAALDK